MSTWHESQEREAKFLANLKVGDVVAVAGGWHPILARITRETPKYWVVGADKYRKDNGYGVGGTVYSRCALHEPTQDIRDEIDKRRLVNMLHQTKWSMFSVETLRAVQAAMAAEAKPESENQSE